MKISPIVTKGFVFWLFLCFGGDLASAIGLVPVKIFSEYVCTSSHTANLHL